MKDSDILHVRTMIVWGFLVILTSLSMYIFCGEFTFGKLPWLRVSATMSTFTCLWTYTFWFGRLISSYNSPRIEQWNAPIYGVAIPVSLFLVCPSKKAMGLDSDSVMWFFFSLVVMHGIGFYIIQRWIRQILSHKDVSKIGEN
jgi:hypothetical protein